VTTQLGVPLSEALAALASFSSTTRRCEWKGDQGGVVRYDDYAHHPAEVAQMIQAFREWYPTQRLVVAFQSHTFSRTKALFNEFVAALTKADEVAMIDIFPSAREAADPTVSSDTLCAAITAAQPSIKARNYQQLPQLAAYLKSSLQPGDVLITMGAGDIYQVHGILNGS
jgi:UDP-N-acetylmuramate--alanine ligase